jgi:proline iminopeptidase
MRASQAAGSEAGDFAEVPGGRVWFRVIGTAPGTPLLLAHGGPGGTHEYLLSHARLAADRPLVFWDQLCSGNSDRPADPANWTIPRFAAEVTALRRHLALDRAMLLGHSWGAAIAATYAGARPAGLVACVLASPFIHAHDWMADNAPKVARLPPEAAAAIARHESAGEYDAPEYRAALRIFYARHLCRLDPRPPEVERSLKRLNETVYRGMNGPSEFTVIGSLRDMDCTPSLARITCPTLLTAGEHDEAAPASVRRYAAMVPGARAEVFAGASHMPHVEAPEAYFTALAAFLAAADRAGG